MSGWIHLQDQARQPEAPVAIEVGKSDPSCGRESFAVKFAGFPSRSDPRYKVPKIRFGGVERSSITPDWNRANDVPCLQLAKRIGHIGSRDPQQIRNLLGCQRILRCVQQRMNLAHGAVTPHRSPKFPHSKTNRLTTSGKITLASVVKLIRGFTTPQSPLVVDLRRPARRKRR